MAGFPVIVVFVHSCHTDSLSFCQEQGDIVRSFQSESMQALNLSRPRWAVSSSELENAGCLPAVLDPSEEVVLKHFHDTGFHGDAR